MSTAIKLRWYQEEALDSVVQAWKRGVIRPLVCLPTGSGKAPLISAISSKFRNWYPNKNILVTVHTKELVSQLASTYRGMSGEEPGIYSASLHKKDPRKVTFAQIQSVYKKTFKNNIGLVCIDECDRVPVDGEGQYKTFVASVLDASPDCRMAGFTATPYRLSSGLVYGDDQPWQELVYDADIRALIKGGYLADLISKNGGKPNLLGVRVMAGDYNQSDLDEVLCDEVVMERAIQEIVVHRKQRKHALYFSPGLKHANKLSEKLLAEGIRAPVIHSGMASGERDSFIAQFKAKIINDLININILTIGFDAPHVDLIVMLRPTKSPALYYQMIGRGLRIHDGKDNCLILDLAGNIEFHGPIDTLNKRVSNKSKPKDVEPGEVPSKICPGCEEVVHAAARMCPHCDFIFPETQLQHGHQATELSPLSSVVKTGVKDVYYMLHPGKLGKPNTIKLIYKLVNGSEVVLWLSCDSHAHPFAHGKWKSWLMAQHLADPFPKDAKLVEARDWIPMLRKHVLLPSHLTYTDDGTKFKEILQYHNES